MYQSGIRCDWLFRLAFSGMRRLGIGMAPGIPQRLSIDFNMRNSPYLMFMFTCWYQRLELHV
jgi:hypothetical protein